MRSGYEPESLILSAQRRTSEFIEFDIVHHLREEAANHTPTQSPFRHAKIASANLETEGEMTASTPHQTSISNSNIELNDVNPRHDEAGEREVQFSLPPVDTGKDAWLFLFSAFIMDILVWGGFSPETPTLSLH